MYKEMMMNEVAVRLSSHVGQFEIFKNVDGVPKCLMVELMNEGGIQDKINEQFNQITSELVFKEIQYIYQFGKEAMNQTPIGIVEEVKVSDGSLVEKMRSQF